MPQISQIFGNVVVPHLPMITFLSAIVSFLSFRIRSRASLELEVIALRHQLGVLKRRRPRSREVFLRGPVALDLALPNLAAARQRHGAGQADDGDAMAPWGFPVRLALAIRATLAKTVVGLERISRARLGAS
jgi:hypothetical protein